MSDISDSVLFLNEQVRVLSSANKVKQKISEKLGKSSMKIKIKSRPCTESCVIELSPKITSFIDTYYSGLTSMI